MQGDMRGLHDRSNRHGKLFLARTAFVETRTVCLAMKSRGLIDDATMWANRPIRPMQGLEIGPGCVFVVENRIGKIDGHCRLQRSEHYQNAVGASSA